MTTNGAPYDLSPGQYLSRGVGSEVELIEVEKDHTGVWFVLFEENGQRKTLRASVFQSYYNRKPEPGKSSAPSPYPRDEHAAKIIDELLVLFQLYREDYNIVNEALQFIAATRYNNPEHPITRSLANYMREIGLID